MKNKAGNVVGPTSLTSAIEATVFNSRFNAGLNDLDSAMAYPIAGFTYIIMQGPKANKTDFPCSRRREVIKFFNYVLTSPLIVRQTDALGYTFASQAMVDRIYESVLNNFTCDGEPLIGIELIVRTPAEQIAVWAVDGAVFLATTIAIALTFFARFNGRTLSLIGMVIRQSKKKLVLVIFGALLYLGVAIACISIIFWEISPLGSDSTICSARLWLSLIGLIIIIGAQTARANQVTIMKSLGVKSTVDSFLLPIRFSRDVLILFGIQVVLLIVWQIVQPFRPILFITDSLNLIGEWRCALDSPIFFGIQAGLFFVSVAYGLVQVYMNWKVNAKTTAQMWLLISFYNFLVTFIIVIPVGLTNLSDGYISALAIIALIFLALQSLATFLVPVWAYYEEILADADTGSNSTVSRRTATAKSMKSMYSRADTGTGNTGSANKDTTGSTTDSDQPRQLSPRAGKDITRFRRWLHEQKDYKWLVILPENFATDKSNYEDFKTIVGSDIYPLALKVVLGELNPSEAKDVNEKPTVERAAKLLYGLAHAKYLETDSGISDMKSLRARKIFGKCLVDECKGCPLIPRGSAKPKEGSARTFCINCGNTFSAKTHLDGAYFGDSFHETFQKRYGPKDDAGSKRSLQNSTTSSS